MRRATWWLVGSLASALGCGRVAYSAADPGDDGGPGTLEDDGGPVDAGLAPTDCPGPFVPPVPASLPPEDARIADGLVAAYTFAAAAGRLVWDHGDVDGPLPLIIHDSREDFRWLEPGLAVEGPLLVSSWTPARGLTDRISSTGELSVEVWVTPADGTQGGPARIVSLSRDTRRRNFTLAQEADRYVFRVRTRARGRNGVPDVLTPPVLREAGRPQHVVATYWASGGGRVYVDGDLVTTFDDCSGIDAWDRDYRLALANEHTRNRPWLGSYHYVAIYDRVLHPDEVAHQHQVSPLRRDDADE